MGEVPVSEIILSSLDKELVVYRYDYERDQVERFENRIRLWSFIVMMYIINGDIKTKKMVEKLENIIKQPKILIVFVRSLKKILYIWLKDYNLHCKLIMRLYPELYNPKRLLMIQNVKTSE